MNYLLIINFYSLLKNKPVIKYDFLNYSINETIDYMGEEKKEYDDYIKKNYFNGEHKDKIASKLNKYLNSTLKGKGMYITEYSISVGIDPYLVTAVMLQETGCRWTCSSLTRNCYNVGGNKGKPGCNGGSYRKFSNINEGIRFAIDKLNSYYKKGLKTPEKINPYYASDKTWYKKVNNYIKLLKG